MKIKIKTIILLSAVMSVFLIGSCSLFFGMSIEDRIDQFESDLNTSDRADIRDNFSENCQDYNQMNTESYWNDNSVFTVDNKPFSISKPDVDGDTATGTITYNGNSPSIEFVMEDGGLWDGWKILEVTVNGIQQIH